MARLYRLVVGLLDGLPYGLNPEHATKCLDQTRGNSNRALIAKVVDFANQGSELINTISYLFGEDLRERWKKFQDVRKNVDIETGRRTAVLSMVESRLRHIAREVKDHENTIRECTDCNRDIAHLRKSNMKLYRKIHRFSEASVLRPGLLRRPGGVINL